MTGRPRRRWVRALVVTVSVGAAVVVPTGARAPASAATRPASTPGPTTLAGTGGRGDGPGGVPAASARFDGPTGLAEDAAGDLFIADTGNCRVREVPARSGMSFGRHVVAGHIVTVAGGPCGGSGAHPEPDALALDDAGDLFIASGPGNRVEELPGRSGESFGVRVTVGVPVTVAGTGAPGFGGDGGPADRSELDDPTGIAVDPQGDLLVADTANCRLRLVAASDGRRYGEAVVAGDIETVAGTTTCGSGGDGGPAAEAQLWDPGALAVDAAGDVAVADQGNRSVRLLASHSASFYGVPLSAGQLGTVAGEGSYGPYLVDGLAATSQVGETDFPTGLAFDSHGDLFIADGALHAIRLLPAADTRVLGRPVVAGDLYLAAGAESVGLFHNRTVWVRTRMVDPAGLVVSTGGGLTYVDSGANLVRHLPG